MATIEFASWRKLNPPGEWADEGLCAQTDPEMFFPEKGGDPTRAKAVCRRCPVRAACLDYAMANKEAFGIWGGLSERERHALRKNQSAA
jgi:WhiB family redox-sensing transcriptional regulator